MKRKFLITAMMLVSIIVSMYAGERYRPFSIAGDIAEYAAARISNQPVRNKTHTAKAKEYVVRKGDTVCGIAEKYGVHPEALKFANELPSNGRIIVGERLVIPDKG